MVCRLSRMFWPTSSVSHSESVASEERIETPYCKDRAKSRKGLGRTGAVGQRPVPTTATVREGSRCRLRAHEGVLKA